MQTKIIIKQLEQTFNGPAWHGPSISETLSALNEENKNSSFKNSHTILELIGHMTAWRKYVIEILSGNDAYTVTDEMNFPKPTDLVLAIAELKSTQALLIKSISDFPESRLAEKVAGKPYSFQAMLHGILHHDLYHLGQLAILNR